MTAHQGRDAVVKLVVDTTEQLTADNWTARTGTATPQGCTKDNGEKGATYQFVLWSTERSEDVHADAQLVVDYWETLGIDTRIADFGGYPVVYGTGGPVLRASFDTDAAGKSYHVSAVAPCAPGDAADLKREGLEQRSQGEVLPGDKYLPEQE